MNNTVAYTITDKSITLMIDTDTYIIASGDERYNQVIDAIREKDWVAIPTILDVKGKLISETNGGIYLLNGMLRCGNDHPVPALMTTRIIETMRKNLDITPLALFLENMYQNPNPASVEELLLFIEACNLPITADGYFLAYKMVKKNFTDIYTGKMDNSVGSRPWMDRSLVDNNREETCSKGLHFCSQAYLGHYGTAQSSQLVILKVNPKDVVSIPTDYNNAKGRACEYEVVDAISWDQIITPLYTDEYSDVPEPDDDWTPEDEYDDEYDDDLTQQDESDFFKNVPRTEEPKDFRWEVRERSTDNKVDTFTTRSAARLYRDLYGSDDNPLYVEDIGSQLHKTPDPIPTPVNSGAVLNDTVVAEIWDRIDSGHYTTFVDLAEEYGVSDRTIRRIKNGESWTHVTGL